jgi:hypothetical protein
MFPSNQAGYGQQANPVTSNGNSFKPPPSFNPFQQPQTANQGFLSPQAGSSNVYASTIHASTSSSNLSKGGFGLGKLESMGRTIKDDSDPIGPRPR